MTDYEMAEAERFAEALEAIEALAEPDLDPREDPTLFSLAALAAEIHDAEQAATQTRPASSPTASAPVPTY